MSERNIQRILGKKYWDLSVVNYQQAKTLIDYFIVADGVEERREIFIRVQKLLRDGSLEDDMREYSAFLKSYMVVIFDLSAKPDHSKITKLRESCQKLYDASSEKSEYLMHFVRICQLIEDDDRSQADLVKKMLRKMKLNDVLFYAYFYQYYLIFFCRELEYTDFLDQFVLGFFEDEK